MSRSDIAATIGFALLTVFAVVLVGTMPRGEKVVVFAAPHAQPGSAANIVAASGGTIVSTTRFDWAVVARFEQPGFASLLYEQGAIFVADAGIATTCFTPIPLKTPDQELKT